MPQATAVWARRALDSSSLSAQPKAEPIKLWLAKVGYERIQEIFTALAHLSTRQIAETSDATGLGENKTAARAGGGIARQGRQQLEDQTGKSVVSSDNYLSGVVAKKT